MRQQVTESLEYSPKALLGMRCDWPSVSHLTGKVGAMGGVEQKTTLGDGIQHQDTPLRMTRAGTALRKEQQRALRDITSKQVGPLPPLLRTNSSKHVQPV